MIQPEYLVPRVQEHVSRVMGVLFTFFLTFTVSIWIGLQIHPSWWNVMILSSCFGTLISIITVPIAPTVLGASLVPFFMGIGLAPSIVLFNIIDKMIVVYALGGTVLIFGTIYFHALTSPVRTYTHMGGLLYSSLTSLIYVGLLAIITGSDMLETVELLFGFLLFCAYVAYDTNLMVTRAYERMDTPNSNNDIVVIFDAMNLFLDFVNLFIKLCRILEKMRRRTKRD